MKYINAIIIPCYNEASRLDFDSYTRSLSKMNSTKIYFVNDGSTDQTISVLNELKAIFPSKVEVVNLKENVGKADAVRQGVRRILKTDSIQFIAFMDADLSTGFDEMFELIAKADAMNQRKCLVFGSRQTKESEGIKKSGVRHVLGRVVAGFTRQIHGLSIYDTQCGAKVFSREAAAIAFETNFESRWLFDVEVFIRLKRFIGTGSIMNHLQEVPLKNWVHQDGSKIGFMDSVKIPLELQKINLKYNWIPTFNILFELGLKRPYTRLLTR